MLLNNASACGQPATLGNGSISPAVGARSPRFSRAFARHDPRNFNVAVGVGRLPMRALLHHPFCAQCFARISGTREHTAKNGNPRRARISSTPPCSDPIMAWRFYAMGGAWRNSRSTVGTTHGGVRTHSRNPCEALPASACQLALPLYSPSQSARATVPMLALVLALVESSAQPASIAVNASRASLVACCACAKSCAIWRCWRCAAFNALVALVALSRCHAAVVPLMPATSAKVAAAAAHRIAVECARAVRVSASRSAVRASVNAV